jgi:hypothetical protein
MEATREPVTTAVLPPVVEIRAARPEDQVEIRRLFRATLLRGRSLPRSVGDLDAYESLCLDWYLRRGQAIVAVEDGRVQGYLLACLDELEHRRWVRRRALRWALVMAGEAVLGRRRGDARTFVRLRIRDAVHGWRQTPPAPFPAHAHVNLAPHLRSARIGPRLAAAMDDLAAAAGHDGWYGEMNVPAGRSFAALERLGVAVTHRQPSRTFTWLEGAPIERVTLARPVRQPAGDTER